ncbi:hypothetical protein BG53_10135 [Paenibacillus darwinianus]|uniref:Uncharacterized protein n=1 Tax=Paenibacillus darwinianus TaxID=1380763 RepID=A0A9W5RZE6_9BACL|nr:hypothetical protein [Paenibacillus darwinianus]EXX84875.1 hypothetical protein CH50_10650 [Paenibacillus darwinianus]EXX84896.1 hypothetical protein BG53_10135 [Paenibacillus darwinianus]EXX84921.1 hypothetical protein BG52_09635 [Paenibacillus darwinianus]
MIEENVLDRYRLQGTKVRVVRDGLEMNDVVGIVVAWDNDSVMIRKPNRRVVKLSRIYDYRPADEPRVASDETPASD